MAELEIPLKYLREHLAALSAVSMLHLNISTHTQRRLFPKSVLIFHVVTDTMRNGVKNAVIPSHQHKTHTSLMTGNSNCFSLTGTERLLLQALHLSENWPAVLQQRLKSSVTLLIQIVVVVTFKDRRDCADSAHLSSALSSVCYLFKHLHEVQYSLQLLVSVLALAFTNHSTIGYYLTLASSYNCFCYLCISVSFQWGWNILCITAEGSMLRLIYTYTYWTPVCSQPCVPKSHIQEKIFKSMQSELWSYYIITWSYRKTWWWPWSGHLLHNWMWCHCKACVKHPWRHKFLSTGEAKWCRSENTQHWRRSRQNYRDHFKSPEIITSCLSPFPP